MQAQPPERKLATIFVADAVGFSRSMGVGEEGTLATLKAHRAILDRLIAAHHGRAFASAGDSVLAEFASVVEAVRCALATQRAVAEANRRLPEPRRLRLRIGVHLGDVMVDGDDLIGDGVNVAARLQGLAEPGGICLSGPTYDQVRHTLALSARRLGRRRLRNIPRPIEVVQIDPGSAASAAGGATPRWRRVAATLALVAAAGALTLLWEALPTDPLRTAPLTEQEVPWIAQRAAGMPSIAVLPFENLSRDPAESYFSDGFTNDLITDLAQFQDLAVIAPNSVLAYKDNPAPASEIGRQLGVRYVLEGRLERTPELIRISAQLVDAETGRTLWAERYDRPAGDVLAVRDEVRRSIVATLMTDKGQLWRLEQRRALSKDTDSLTAYDYRLRGLYHYSRYDRESLGEARALFLRAIEADPTYARAYADLAWTHLLEVYLGYAREPAASIDEALRLAEQAAALDDTSPDAHWALAGAFVQKRWYDRAIGEYERALALSPNNADIMVDMADALNYAGRPREAIATIEAAMRLNPRYPFSYLWILGYSHYQLGDYQEAIDTFLRISEPLPDVRRALAASYAMAGRLDEARAEMVRAIRAEPAYTVEKFRRTQPFKDPEVLARFVTGLQLAGLPETDPAPPSAGRAGAAGPAAR